MSDANRTVEEYTKLYARKHGIDIDAARDAAVVKEFTKEVEHERLQINQREA